MLNVGHDALTTFDPGCNRKVYPKKFAKIASALPNKTCADCVKFYYRTKKHNKYKEKREEMKRIKAEKRKLQNKVARDCVSLCCVFVAVSV